MTNEKLQMRNERGRERGKRRTRKEKRKEKDKKEEGQGKRTRKEKKKTEKGMHPCIPLHKIIDSISANYRNHNCQCSIYETNYLS